MVPTRNPLEWDIFISHASEDKNDFVRPLATALQRLGLSVWYDEFSLNIGDSLSRSIDEGLAKSAYGVVVISPAFLAKPWPQHELRGLLNRDIEEDKVILPIWHGVTREQVKEFSPTLVDKVAINTSLFGADDVAIQIMKIVRPDLYVQHPRSELERIVSGEVVADLQQEIERVRHELAKTQEELSQYQCPFCMSPLIGQVNAPDEHYDNWDLRETYECGHQTFGGAVEHPCPADPNFPKLEEYDFEMYHEPKQPDRPWLCIPRPRSKAAQTLRLDYGEGKTEEEARQSIIECYHRHARIR